MNTEMPTYKKRFGEIGIKVIIRIFARWITEKDSPRCRAVALQLRQAVGMKKIQTKQ